ncbi:PREDICTED: uncharacterized protein LOC109395868 isoform X1 [Hipposideros armiger]|uniref:Uncharacterized protein LOC109395868 isoform X1 n=1 Tax=Hipposideros armiger TaxID=186990 RepID=A0A8B7TCJ3_HIPAR|nr:PREDICTED: uncharacterized protein LOC109395868 isoform X1 [Hipposideros armiger]
MKPLDTERPSGRYLHRASACCLSTCHIWFLQRLNSQNKPLYLSCEDKEPTLRVVEGLGQHGIAGRGKGTILWDQRLDSVISARPGSLCRDISHRHLGCLLLESYTPHQDAEAVGLAMFSLTASQIGIRSKFHEPQATTEGRSPGRAECRHLASCGAWLTLGSSRTVWGEEEEPSSRNAHQQYPALEGTAHKERGPEPLRFVKEELGLLPAQLVLRAFASRGRTCTSFSSCGWESGVLLHRRTEQDCTQRLPREAFKAKCKGRPHWQPGPGDLNGR